MSRKPSGLSAGEHQASELVLAVEAFDVSGSAIAVHGSLKVVHRQVLNDLRKDELASYMIRVLGKKESFGNMNPELGSFKSMTHLKGAFIALFQ